MEKENLIVLIILFLIFFSVFFAFYKISSENTLEVKFVVGDELGITTDTDKLDFGMVFRDSRVSRNLILENKNNYDVKTRFYISNNLRDYIVISNDTIIPKNDIKRIEVILAVPKEIERGEYNGKLRYKFEKVS